MLSYFVCWYTIVLIARPPAKIIKKIFGALHGANFRGGKGWWAREKISAGK